MWKKINLWYHSSKTKKWSTSDDSDSFLSISITYHSSQRNWRAKLNLSSLNHCFHSILCFFLQNMTFCSFLLNRINQISIRCWTVLMKSILVRSVIQRSLIWKCLCSYPQHRNNQFLYYEIMWSVRNENKLCAQQWKMMRNSNMTDGNEINLEINFFKTKLFLDFNIG
jgi:hypothetical protein